MKEKIIIALVAVVLVVVVALYLNMKTNVVNNNTTNPVGTTVNTGNNSNTNTPNANSIVSTANSDSFGKYLTDTKGLALYVFADDGKLVSNCTGDCLKKWPPYIYDNKNLASSTDSLSQRMNVIKRSDGTYQYSYGPQPVYYYIGDKNPGDTNGVSQGVVSKWGLVVIK